MSNEATIDKSAAMAHTLRAASLLNDEDVAKIGPRRRVVHALVAALARVGADPDVVRDLLIAETTF